jgi:hypothetical protein
VCACSGSRDPSVDGVPTTRLGPSASHSARLMGHPGPVSTELRETTSERHAARARGDRRSTLPGCTTAVKGIDTERRQIIIDRSVRPFPGVLGLLVRWRRRCSSLLARARYIPCEPVGAEGTTAEYHGRGCTGAPSIR